MDFELLERVEQLENQLAQLNPNSVVTATIEATSVGQLATMVRHIPRFKKEKLVTPFLDSPTQNYYFVKYKHRTRPNITIIVKADESASMYKK